MTANQIRQKYLNFFADRGHAVIPSAPLVPENDPTTLFNSAGMQPLIQYILGTPHPSGKRLVNSQKAIRTQDISEVGDNRHTTFFEMLGNWSLGDYFKAEQLSWIFTFLTQELKLDPRRLFVSVFAGNKSVSKDTEAVKIWQEIYASVGIEAREGERIFAYPAKNNWWSRAGEPEKMPPGEPGGPDSEVFYDLGAEYKFHEHSPFAGTSCHLNCDCGRFLEIANSVFMQYQKLTDGSLTELPAKVVDFGGGLERQVAAENNTPDIFQTDMFSSIIQTIQLLSHKKYGVNDQETRAMRIIADHMRGSVMLVAEGVMPSNKQQGYILRRLIRRSLLYGRNLGLTGGWEYLGKLTHPVALIYQDAYPEVMAKIGDIIPVINEEALRFGETLKKGLREIEKVPEITGDIAFKIYETYGFPWEMTEEIAREKGQNPDKGIFEKEFKKHQEISRTATAGIFKGGLADHSEQTTRLHTATHLLHQALRLVLGQHVAQKGSNITVQRLRFDFSHPRQLTSVEIEKVEQIINEQIDKDLPVSYETTSYKNALKVGVLAFFGERYPDQVKVYTVGNFSREICGGPHVKNTGKIGKFWIVKEESAGAGIRRIYAQIGDS
ncbi:hypothetical protein A2154_00195 [Candidatus Gottesmanbacteria bacterium RBG_16_43_7]|uniref:Alanine--tRNA ligase n=1 Tax=Candidatus Gottesmanbacteria bacterium RBG_16_43_7 TaxID=1798373 RepID=A0A1F5ZA03_9BACT|nr:MAG: hypothetical protein A2154_00195 [Candidatus Gottesmanbacteria bacterium RBG_16_43_7]